MLGRLLFSVCLYLLTLNLSAQVTFIELPATQDPTISRFKDDLEIFRKLLANAEELVASNKKLSISDIGLLQEAYMRMQIMPGFFAQYEQFINQNSPEYYAYKKYLQLLEANIAVLMLQAEILHQKIGARPHRLKKDEQGRNTELFESIFSLIKPLEKKSYTLPMPSPMTPSYSPAGTPPHRFTPSPASTAAETDMSASSETEEGPDYIGSYLFSPDDLEQLTTQYEAIKEAIKEQNMAKAELFLEEFEQLVNTKAVLVLFIEPQNTQEAAIIVQLDFAIQDLRQAINGALHPVNLRPLLLNKLDKQTHLTPSYQDLEDPIQKLNAIVQEFNTMLAEINYALNRTGDAISYIPAIDGLLVNMQEQARRLVAAHLLAPFITQEFMRIYFSLINAKDTINTAKAELEKEALYHQERKATVLLPIDAVGPRQPATQKSTRSSVRSNVVKSQ